MDIYIYRFLIYSTLYIWTFSHGCHTCCCVWEPASGCLACPNNRFLGWSCKRTTCLPTYDFNLGILLLLPASTRAFSPAAALEPAWCCAGPAAVLQVCFTCANRRSRSMPAWRARTGFLEWACRQMGTTNAAGVSGVLLEGPRRRLPGRLAARRAHNAPACLWRVSCHHCILTYTTTACHPRRLGPLRSFKTGVPACCLPLGTLPACRLLPAGCHCSLCPACLIPPPAGLFPAACARAT